MYESVFTSKEQINNMQLVLRDTGTNGHVREKMLLDCLRSEHDNMSFLIQLFAGLSLYDSHEGSVVIHLRCIDDEDNAVEMLQKAFITGRLRQMISDILEQSGINKNAVIHVTFQLENRKTVLEGMGFLFLFFVFVFCFCCCSK